MGGETDPGDNVFWGGGGNKNVPGKEKKNLGLTGGGRGEGPTRESAEEIRTVPFEKSNEEGDTPQTE